MAEAVSVVKDGDVVMIGGFGSSGIPLELIEALRRHAPKDLTIISNNAGVAEEGIASLLRDGLVRKMVCSFPARKGRYGYRSVTRKAPSTLSWSPGHSRRAHPRGGAGLAAFYTPTAYGTLLAEGKETREFNGKGYVLETALHADVALIRGEKGDAWGNLTYNTAGRNFNPSMAMAAKTTIAEVKQIVEVGDLDPEAVVTPGIFVDTVVLQEGLLDAIA